MIQPYRSTEQSEGLGWGHLEEKNYLAKNGGGGAYISWTYGTYLEN